MKLEHLIDIKLQPIFNASSNNIGYAEVLLRSVNAKTSTLDVLNTFEKNNKTVELDTYILKRACKVIRENKDLRVKLTVNVTKQTIEVQNIYYEIAKVIKARGIDPARIIIELNEETAFNNDDVINNVNGLINCGVSVAIDDFGRGNTSLANISKFNVDIIKFDRNFLRITDDKKMQLIAKLVSKMHMVGINTVIEGVETVEQLDAVRQIGYGHIQGFILAKPMTTKAYTEKYMH